MGRDRPLGADGTSVFAGGGEAGRLMAAFDWSATPVGPVASWPASLRFAVRSVLASRFPMVMTWGPEFTQFYNDAYAPLIGAKHPAIGQDIRITLAEGWDALGPPVEHAMRTREASWLPALPLPLERAGYREETYFTVSHAPAFDDDGEVAGMHGVCTEVTAQIVGERRTRLLHGLSVAVAQLGDAEETAEQLCAALDGGPLDVPFAAVYLLDRTDGRLHRVAVVGCAAEHLPESAADEADLLPDPVEALGVTGGPWGDPVTEAVVLPLAASAGAPVGMLLAGVNPNRALDDDHRAFHALLAGQFAGALVDAQAFDSERERAESLAELDRAKTAFFANVSHELRTPLTLLLGPLADVLDGAAGALPAEAGQQLALALRNGHRLQRLVNDLLDFVSIEAGRAGAQRVEIDVAGFTVELAGVLRAAAERAGLTLTVDCPPLGRPAYVDPRMWEKIVLNLLSNAVKYTFVGGIDVRLRAAGDRFELTVADTGVGIPPDELPHLFERFFRGSDSASRSREGTGIGLALVQELAGLHGGTVTATSAPGAGSTFTVALPYGSPDVADGAGPVLPAPSADARSSAAPWLEELPDPDAPAPVASSGQTVLVVDDNADMRTYLTRVLSPIWTVRTTADGAEALAAVAAELPDIVLTDVMMPRVDGFELLRALRADPATRHVPVIMLTARAGQEAAVEGLDAGADDYLAKPFQAPELIARLRVVLDRVVPRDAPGPPSAPLPVVVASAPPTVAVSVDAARLPPVPPGRPGSPPRPPAAGQVRGNWRFPSTPSAVPSARRRLRALFDELRLDEEHSYDLLLATCEAVTNAVEHAQEPSAPHVHVTVTVAGEVLEVTVRDHGRWRERVPSMDRGRGSMLMSAFAEISAIPSAEGTTVYIRSPFPRRGTANRDQGGGWTPVSTAAIR